MESKNISNLTLYDLINALEGDDFAYLNYDLTICQDVSVKFQICDVTLDKAHMETIIRTSEELFLELRVSDKILFNKIYEDDHCKEFVDKDKKYILTVI